MCKVGNFFQCSGISDTLRGQRGVRQAMMKSLCGDFRRSLSGSEAKLPSNLQCFLVCFHLSLFFLFLFAFSIEPVRLFRAVWNSPAARDEDDFSHFAVPRQTRSPSNATSISTLSLIYFVS